MRFAIAAAAVLAFAGAAAAQTTRRVPQDYDTIQQAEDDCDPGDTIKIAAGRYYENVTLNVADVKVIGSGVVWDGNIDGVDGVCLYINATGCMVQGITFRNGTYQVDVNNAPVTVTKCTFIDPTQDGVYVDGGSTAVITSCRFTGMDSDFIQSYGDPTTVLKCTGRGASDFGIWISGNDSRVEGCTLAYIYDNSAIYIVGTSPDVVKNKIFNIGCASGTSGVYCSGVDAVVSGNTVAKIDNGWGIYVTGTNPLVEKCKVTDSVGAIYANGDGVTVNANKVSDVHGGTSGIEVRGDDMTAIGNSAALGSADSWGYWFVSATGTGGGNIVKNKATDFLDAGAYFQPSNNVSVSGFTTTRCGSYDTYGFRIEGVTSSYLGLAAFDCENDGIVLRNATTNDNEFENCVVKNSTGNGYLVLGVGNEYTNCTAINCGEGLDNRGTSTVVSGGKYRGDRFDITNNAAGGATFSGGLGSVDFVTGGSTQQSEID